MIGSKRVWWLALLIAAFACLATAWFGRPAYRKFKEARSVHQARVYIEKEDYRSANLSLRIALALNNSNVIATSMMSEMFDKVQSPMAVGWHRRLCELEPALSNRVNFAACALRFEKRPFPITTQTLKEIEKEGQSNTAFHVVASRLALMNFGRLRIRSA